MTSNQSFFIAISSKDGTLTYHSETFSSSAAETTHKVAKLNLIKYGEKADVFVEEVRLFHVEDSRFYVHKHRPFMVPG